MGWRWLAVLAVPAAYLAATAWTTGEIRPLWMGGSTDPTYPYVLNALLVAEGRPPEQATHPGTPLQVLGAVVLRAAHGLSGSALDLRRHVLTDPEYFTDAFRATLVALIALGTLAQGLAALHLTGSALCAMAAQAAPLASVWGVRSSALVMCEPLVLALGFGASALVLRSLRRGADASSAEAALIGALVGIAIATKVMYVSLALLPLLWLRGRPRLIAAVTMAAAFALGVAPLWRKLPAVAVWLLAILGHTGAWGAGPSGFISFESFPRALAAILAGDPLIHAAIALVVAAAVLCRSVDPTVRATRRCAWAVAATAAAAVLLGAKQSAIATYYHIPAVSLAGLAVALAYRLFSAAAPASRWRQGLATLWLAAAVAYQAWWLEGFLERRRPVRPAATEAARAAAAAAGGDRFLQGYSVSSVASALTFANEWAGRRFSADLRALYPRAYSYDWAGLHFFGRPLTVGELDSLRVGGDSFVLWDAAWWPYGSWDWFRGAAVEPVGSYRRDQLFRARLVPVEENAAATSPPFAGVLILTGSTDRPSLERVVRPYIEPLGPVTRLAVLGTGGPAHLVAECRYVGSGGQTLRVQVNGREAYRQELGPSEEWPRLSVPLPPRTGLIEVDILYDRLFENPDAARPRFPGYADAERDARWPAVRYRLIQVQRPAGPGGA